VRIRAYTPGDAIDVAFGTAQSVTHTSTGANQWQRTNATPSITPGGTVAAGHGYIVELERNAADGADTLAVDARLIGVHLEFS
jgi:hypothetical protein